MWKNIVDWGRPQMTKWRMRIACWIPKAINTHSGCVILIAFPLQQYLHKSASLLRYTYITCLFLMFLWLGFWTSLLACISWYLFTCVSLSCFVKGMCWWYLFDRDQLNKNELTINLFMVITESLSWPDSYTYMWK